MPSRAVALASNGLLIAGVIMALISNRYVTEMISDAAVGVVVLAPDPSSPEWHEIAPMREIADRAFYLGLGLTAAGILLGLLAFLRGATTTTASLESDNTNLWIWLTLGLTLITVCAAYLFGKQSIIAAGQTLILAVTAVALFLYARDTARQLHITEEVNYKPLAKLALMQWEMTWDDLRCPLMLRVLRHVPFVARVDLQLEIEGQLVPTECDMYDGKEEWVIYASFRHLPGEIRTAIRKRFTSEVQLRDFLSRPSTSNDKIETRIAVTPLMLYRAAGSATATLTSAARSYLKVTGKNGSIAFQWMPDVQRSRYRSMVWSKDLVRAFTLETEIECS